WSMAALNRPTSTSRRTASGCPFTSVPRARRRSRSSSPAVSFVALPRDAVRQRPSCGASQAKSWGGSVNLRASRKIWLTRALPVAAAAALATGALIAIAPSASAAVSFQVESLDGSANNVNNPNWGKAGLPYARVGPAKYTDGISQPFGGPNPRQISNRIFNDRNVDVFDERRITQFGWQFGQF